MNIRDKILVVLGMFSLAGCSKDPLIISSNPEISFVSVTPNAVKEYSDSLVFTINYTDGDGDLGENVSGAENFFLVDTRNDVTYKFRIPQLAPTGEKIAIKGKLSVKLDNTAITDNSASQSVTYKMYVKDRAGNQSNTVNSTIVKVTK